MGSVVGVSFCQRQKMGVERLLYVIDLVCAGFAGLPSVSKGMGSLDMPGFALLGDAMGYLPNACPPCADQLCREVGLL